MIYKSFVLRLVLFDLGLFFVLVILFLLTFFPYRNIPELRKYTKWTFIFILGGISVLWNYRGHFIDARLYLQKGDAYVQKTACIVRSLTGTTDSRLLAGEEDLTCMDGEHFHTREIHNGLMILPRGREVVLYYLPRSRQIVDIRTPEGEVIWSGSETWQKGKMPCWLSSLLGLLTLYFARRRQEKATWAIVKGANKPEEKKKKKKKKRT